MRGTARGATAYPGRAARRPAPPPVRWLPRPPTLRSRRSGETISWRPPPGKNRVGEAVAHRHHTPPRPGTSGSARLPAAAGGAPPTGRALAAAGSAGGGGRVGGGVRAATGVSVAAAPPAAT